MDDLEPPKLELPEEKALSPSLRRSLLPRACRAEGHAPEHTPGKTGIAVDAAVGASTRPAATTFPCRGSAWHELHDRGIFRRRAGRGQCPGRSFAQSDSSADAVAKQAHRPSWRPYR